MKYKTKYNEKQKQLVYKINELGRKTDLSEISLKDLCSKLDISTGTFYHYFEDKEDMLVQVFNTIEEYIFENCNSKLTDHWKNNIRCIAYAFYEYNRIGSAKMVFIVQGKTMAQSSYILNEKDKYSYKTAASQFETGIKNGEINIDLDADELTKMMFAIIRGNIMDWARSNCGYDLTKRAEKSVEIFLNGITKSN